MAQCPYGYFCPAGTSVATSNRCPTNFFCGVGVANGMSQSCTAAVPLSAWFDADGDGDVDVVGSTALGGVLLLRDSSTSVVGSCNDGLTRGLPALTMASMQRLVIADVDGDGDDDVLGVTVSSNVVLLVNNGSGFFVNATAASGLAVAANVVSSVSVGDVDGDGDVDVFVSAASSSSVLMQNNGSGVFMDVTMANLLPNRTGTFVTSTMADVDGDGDLDVFVAMSTGNRLYINSGNGTLVESASARGVASYTGGGVVQGCTAADVDGDGDVDVLVFGSGPKQLYVNNGTGWFIDAAATLGVPAAVVNATSASFGDVDNDGDVDLVMCAPPSFQCLFYANNGSGGFNATAVRLGSSVSPQTVLVDVDGDGDVDAPSVGFTNGVVPSGFVGAGVATVRVLSRAGRLVCHGATVTVRRSSDRVVVTSRVVTAGSEPYDVHVAKASLTEPIDVDVSFPSGRRHSKSTQAALSGLRLSSVSSLSLPLIVVRDTPGIASVRLLPSSGVFGVGSMLIAIVRALGDESGLAATASCTMNGVSVTSNVVDWGNGTYTFAYTVASSHASSASLSASVALVDARWGVTSDVASIAFSAVSVDTTPPLVSFNATANCSPDNETVTATVNQTLCASCGSLSAEPYGCFIWLRANASLPPQRITASATNNSVVVTVGPYAAGEKPVVVAWAEDAAGNVGPSAVLMWEVDLTSPVTVWTPFNPPSHTNRTSMLFSFGCSQRNCSFDYAFGSSPRVRLGGGVNATSGAAATLTAVDTALDSLPPRFSTAASVTLSLSALVNDSVVAVNGSSGNTTVEVKLDAGAWTDVRQYGSAFNNATQQLSLGGLSDGEHALQARSRVSDDDVDVSPWTHVWTVDRRGPNVSFWLAPPSVSVTPHCTASFLLAADEDAASIEVQWRAVSVSSGDDGGVNGSAWTTATSGALSLTGLTAAVPYVLHARATDVTGNVGAVSSWRWSSGACPSTASLAVALALESYAVANDTRAVMWSVTSALSVLPSEVQYRVNDGPWLRTVDRPILLRGLSATTQYRVDVRPAVPCGCEAVIPEQAWSSVRWFTYEDGPGRVGIVSAPTLSSNSLFGDFELNSTARSAWFEYSLDGGSFAGCSSSLRVGPLATGPHNVTVRSVNSSGAFVVDAQQTYSWTVVSLSSSSLSLVDLPDGTQSLKVWAVKGSVEERSPRTVRWVVDTAPPSVSTMLVTPSVSNGNTAVFTASCLSESFPGLCVYCVSVSLNGGVASRSCTSNGTTVVVTSDDGMYEAVASAMDAAGNEGPAQRLSWSRDTAPPNTSVAVNTALTPVFSVPLLSLTATNASMLVLGVSSSEVVSGYAVSLDGVAVGVGLMTSGPSVALNSTDGVRTLAVSAVDVAGNMDTTPSVVRLLVDTVWPSTSAVTTPAVVSNVSSTTMSWRASGELPGMLSRFDLSSTPALAGLPRFLTPGDGGMALQASLTLVGMSSGAYAVTARAVDAVGHVDAVGASFSFVVDLDAPTTHLVHSLTPFVNVSTVSVSVNASDALSSVAAYVRVDGGVWQNVSSSSSVSLTLADGAHRIECRGVDAAGNTQPPPHDGVDVTVDTTPPSIGVAAGAVPTFNALSVVTLSVLVSDATLTRVRGVLDGAVDTAVSRVGGGVVSVGVAADGNHTLVLSSEDAAGNAGSVVSVSWYTDRVSPVTSATFVGASRFVRDTSASVSVSCVNEAFPSLCVACWQYAVVDAGSGDAMLMSMGRCELMSTLSFAYTADGVASVDVFSVDAAGNVGGNASRVTWVWDRTAPDTVLSLEGGVRLSSTWLVNNASVTLVLSSSESVSMFNVSIDGVVHSVVNASSFQLADLAAGRHVVAATAIDVAGNVDDSAATMMVVVDVTAPPPPRFTLLHERGCFVLPQSPVYVCNSSDALAFDAVCSETDSSDTAPCFVEWRMDTLSVSAVSSSGGDCVVNDGASTSGPGVGTQAGAVGASWARVNGSLVLPEPSRDGQYRVWWRAVDAAGNAGVADSMQLWLDTTPPSTPPSFVSKPDAVSFLTTARFEVQAVGDTSPGRLSVVYELTRGTVVEPLGTAPLPEPTNDDTVQLLVGDLVGDVSYSMRAWMQDQAGHRSAKAAQYSWFVASVAPTVAIASRPSPVSSLMQPVFVFSAVWGNGTSRQGVVPDASFLVSLVGLNSPHSPCDERGGGAPNCSSWCNGRRCVYSPRLDIASVYTLQVQAVLGGRAGDVVSEQWEYRRCRNDQFAVITDGDAIACKPCPSGGDCTPSSSTDVVTQADIVARAGYWASSSSDGSRFYRCPILSACMGGGNGSRAVCATGYDHVACGLCADGYFEQFGLCVACPKSSGTSIVALLGLVLLLIALCTGLYLVRDVLPIDVIKLGVSMVQIIASANSAYDIPWPSAFRRFLSLLRVFLVDVVSITQASCAQPMNYYASLMVVCIGLKLALALLLLGPWLWSKLAARSCQCRLIRAVRRSASSASVEVSEAGPGQAPKAARGSSGINWMGVFKASFMLLFIAYPGVSLKVLRLFKCREIEGVWWLAADMRLRCYGSCGAAATSCSARRQTRSWRRRARRSASCTQTTDAVHGGGRWRSCCASCCCPRSSCSSTRAVRCR
jgi:hypothetical protein